MSTTQQQQEKVETGLLASLIPVAMRSLKWEQRMLAAHQSANHKALYGETVPMSDESDAVNVDSPTTVNHYNQPPKPSGLGKVALVLGALACGGAGAAIPLALSALKSNPEPAPVVETGDSTRYSISLGTPED